MGKSLKATEKGIGDWGCKRLSNCNLDGFVAPHENVLNSALADWENISLPSLL